MGLVIPVFGPQVQSFSLCDATHIKSGKPTTREHEVILKQAALNMNLLSCQSHQNIHTYYTYIYKVH